ncbi:MAG: DNA double-strand break repair nuclease NurA [Thaumarchaeota archaeon]|nr:DNA double-strand break repair nuclease NurA [Nitrososphaerota archaeon]
MEAEQRGVADWTRMPAELQHLFFVRAEEEARRCKQLLLEKADRLKDLAAFVRTEELPETVGWEKMRVAVVDGSNSPSTSERLGGRFGTYCAAYLIFEGKKVVDEGYSAGHIFQEQLGVPEATQKALTLLRVGLERDAALDCLEKDVDLVLIDGSFFGFRADAHIVRDLEIGTGGFESGRDLVYALRDKSRRLLESGRAVGIIKRTRTSALDGWLVYRNGDESKCINTNDKHILTSILPVGHWLAYEWLFDSPRAFNHFTRFRDAYRFLVLREKKQLDMEHVLDAAKRNVEHSIKDALDVTGDVILKAARYYARCCGAPPFEFEAKAGADVEQWLGYFRAFHNPATGLPWPIDLADEDASLPTGFNREFVEEIEARLIRDPEVQDKLELQAYFSYLNPQKEED